MKRSRSWASDSAASPAGTVARRRRRSRMCRGSAAIAASRNPAGVYQDRRAKRADPSIIFYGIRSPIFVERHAEDDARPRRDLRNAVLDRLQSINAADGDQTIPRAEQNGVAKPGREITAARLGALGDVAEQELAAREAVGRLVAARAEDDRHLNGEEDRAAQVAVQGVEAAGPVAQQDRRRRRLAGVAAHRPEALPIIRVVVGLAE